MSERNSPSPKERFTAARDRLRGALGRLLVPIEETPVQSPFKLEAYPINVAGFYEAYAEARTRLVDEARQQDVDLASNVGRAAALCMHALTEVVYDRSRHGLYYTTGFAYPEVRAQRQGNSKKFVDAADVTLNPETRDTALEFTQAWITHASRREPDEYPDRAIAGSLQHMGCSLTVDCLPAGITFEDLGIRPTPEITSKSPAVVFMYLEVEPQMFPKSSIIDDVTGAFQQRVADW